METQTVFTPYSLVTDEEEGLRIAYANEQDGRPKKLKLSVRKLAFEVELSRIHLPRDREQQLYFALEQRQKTIEGRYMLVCLWSHWKKREAFWKKFNCRTLEELLNRMGLPNGKTLGIWEALVHNFDKETFLLVGDELLGYMSLQVADFQKDPKLQRRDYQAIFDNYCAKYTAFEPSSFIEIVNWYVNTHYVKETKKPKTPFDMPPVDTGKGITRHKVRVEIPIPESEADSEHSQGPDLGFDVKRETCSGCRDRDERLVAANEKLDAARRHIERLEEVIRTNLGPQFVPQRPKILEMDIQ